MAYDFNCVDSFKSAVISAQNNNAARQAFLEGLALSPIWRIVSRLTTNSTGRFPYDVEPKNTKINMTLPEPDSCDSNPIALRPDDDVVRQWYYAERYKQNIQMCKTECRDEASVLSELVKAEKKVGAGFGTLFEQMFWNGNATGGAGIFNSPGVEFRNLTGDANFGDLSTADANTLANFFTQLFQGKDNPVVYMGSSLLECIGWRALNSADGCSEIFECLLSLLANRLNESVDTVRGRIQTFEELDCVTGIDANDPTATHAVILVIDRDQVQMGSSDLPILGCGTTQGEDMVITSRKMIMTSPIVYKQCAVEFIFGFIPQEKIDMQAESKYCSADDRCCMTVPVGVCAA